MLLVLLGLLLRSGHCINIGDLQYGVPSCTVNNASLLNSLGQLTLSTDLLGRYVTLQVRPDATQISCRLCAINASYCTQTFAQAGLPAPLHLTIGSNYNLKTIFLTENASAIVVPHELDASNGLLTLDTHAMSPYTTQSNPDTLCGNVYRLVVFILMTSDSPLRRDYFAVVGDANSPTTPCDQQATLAGLSCRLAPRFAYTELRVQNCLASGVMPLPPPLVTPTIHSVLYWQANRNQWPSGPLPRVCGEDWATLWDRVAPQNYLCSADLALYIKPKPWYECALETSVALFNGAGQLDPELLWALDTLDNYCAVRDSGAVTLEESILYNVTVALRQRHLIESEQECDGLDVDQSTVLWPYYAQHFYDWQVQLLQYMFVLDVSLPGKAGLLVAAIVSAVVSCIAACAWVLTRLYGTELWQRCHFALRTLRGYRSV